MSGDAVPDKFLFSIGAHGSDSFEVRWDGEMVVFAHRSSRNKLLALERVAPSSVDWGAFWTWMDEHGCWDWPEVCVNKIAVADGSHWNLVIDVGDRHLISGGNNAYPGSEGADPSDEFRAFLDQMGRLLGGLEIY